MSKDATRRAGEDGDGRRGMPLVRTRWAIAGMIAGVVGSSWLGISQPRPRGADAQAGAAEEPDGTIGGAVRKVTQRIEDASTDVRDRINKAREVSRKVSLVSEVNARLRQDKALDSSQIDVSVEEEGTVILKGQVPDDASKEMAVDLTRDIRSVVQVVDHLAIPPRPRVIAAEADDDPSTPARPRRTR